MRVAVLVPTRLQRDLLVGIQQSHTTQPPSQAVVASPVLAGHILVVMVGPTVDTLALAMVTLLLPSAMWLEVIQQPHRVPMCLACRPLR